MRTNLDIDEDVLAAAKELAAAGRSTAGKVLSDLNLTALSPDRVSPNVCNGVPLLAPHPDSRPVTMEEVNSLRDSQD